MQRSHRDPKLVRFLGARSWAGIGVIAAIAIAAVQWEPLADFVCGLIGESRLVRDGEAILIATADDLPHSQAIVGDTIRIDSAISVDRSVYVVANDLKFGPSGSIRASEVTIFATSVTGGSLDVSGADVTTLGGNGSDGGTIFIASGRVNGTRIDAVGGRGGKGEDGASGVDGQDGKCGASIPLLNIDNWRGSKPGSDGVDGGDGGGRRPWRCGNDPCLGIRKFSRAERSGRQGRYGRPRRFGWQRRRWLLWGGWESAPPLGWERRGCRRSWTRRCEGSDGHSGD